MEFYFVLWHESIGLALTWTSFVPNAAASCVYVNEAIART